MLRRERRSVLAAEAVGPYTLLRVDRGELEPEPVSYTHLTLPTICSV